MKILLLGKNGQVGWELQRSLAPLGEVIALDRQGEAGLCGDLSNLDGLRETIRLVRPDAIVNAAAYTAVDKAESEGELAYCINCLASEVMAQEILALDGWLVHFSTDYVFDGSGSEPWDETHAVAPINHYGSSKEAGERAIVDSGCKYLILRTSWVYGARGNNFAKTMLRLAKDREQLKVIADQVGAPTGAELLADVTAIALKQALRAPELKGLYHLAAAGETSWHGYAGFVINLARSLGEELAVQDIWPIATSEYPTPAARPHNSRLNTQKIRNNFSLHLPDWQSGVTRMLKETLTK